MVSNRWKSNLETQLIVNESDDAPNICLIRSYSKSTLSYAKSFKINEWGLGKIEGPGWYIPMIHQPSSGNLGHLLFSNIDYGKANEKPTFRNHVPMGTKGIPSFNTKGYSRCPRFLSLGIPTSRAVAGSVASVARARGGIDRQSDFLAAPGSLGITWRNHEPCRKSSRAV